MALDLSRFKNTLLLQRKSLVVGIALLISSFFILALGAYPLWGNIATVNTKLKQEQQALSKIQQRVNLVSALTEEDMMQFDITSDSLPTQKEPLSVVQHLQSLSAEAGVSLGKFDVNPGLISTESGGAVVATRRSRDSKSPSATQFLDLETEFTGTFSKIRQLIIFIENSRPVLEIQTLTLDPERKSGSGNSDTIRYVAKIRLRSYFALFDPKVLVGAGVQPLNKEQENTLKLLTQMRSWNGGQSQGGGTSTIPAQGFVNNDIFGIGANASASPTPLLTPRNPTDSTEAPNVPTSALREPQDEVSDQTVEQL